MKENEPEGGSGALLTPSRICQSAVTVVTL